MLHEDYRAEDPARAEPKNRLFRAVFIAGFMASLAVLGCWFVYSRMTDPVGVVFGFTPAEPIQVVTLVRHTMMPLTVIAADGRELPVLDVVTGEEDTRYYLLAESATSANLYQKTRKGALTQLTDTPTWKYGLSVDEASGSFAYQGKEVDTPTALYDRDGWNVVVFNRAEGAERIVTSGVRSSLLPGGQYVAVESGSSVVIHDLSTRDTSPLLELPEESRVVFDGRMGVIALYNPSTRRIDTFSFSSEQRAANFVSSSMALPFVPEALGFVDGHAYAARVDILPGEITYNFIDTETREYWSIPGGMRAGIPQRLIDL